MAVWSYGSGAGGTLVRLDGAERWSTRPDGEGDAAVIDLLFGRTTKGPGRLIGYQAHGRVTDELRRIALAHEMGRDLVARGVEEDEAFRIATLVAFRLRAAPAQPARAVCDTVSQRTQGDVRTTHVPRIAA